MIVLKRISARILKNMVKQSKNDILILKTITFHKTAVQNRCVFPRGIRPHTARAGPMWARKIKQKYRQILLIGLLKGPITLP